VSDSIAPIPSQKIESLKGLGTSGVSGVQKSGVAGFQQILQGKVKPVIKFSGHALERLQKNNITLSPQDMERLSEAVEKAETKGSRESLVLMDDLALIVSIKNHTVITAIDGQRLKENVFTNIDSAVII
jgi:flagellar operon protein